MITTSGKPSRNKHRSHSKTRATAAAKSVDSPVSITPTEEIKFPKSLIHPSFVYELPRITSTTEESLYLTEKVFPSLIPSLECLLEFVNNPKEEAPVDLNPIKWLAEDLKKRSISNKVNR